MGIGIVSDVFMSAIERITSQTTLVTLRDDHGQVIKQKKVPVWNPTVANLTLMALGSSAPEILLSVIETVSNLGAEPGELGASTIVGSASFNLLVISGVSILAVNEKNDTDPDRDDTVPKGVKKINDMGVFGITTVSSLFAYVWMYLCLQDQKVELYESVLTFAFFFILIIFAYFADIYNAKKISDAKLLEGKENDEDKPTIEFQAIEIYRELISEKCGEASKDPTEVKKREKMKAFLREALQTDQIENVNLEDLKTAVDGESMIKRIKYRKQVGNYMAGKRKVMAKGEVFRQEHRHAEHIEDHLKNDSFGFKCLHYSVSEASGHIQIMIINKRKVAGKVLVKTLDAEAKAGEDYEELVEELSFKGGEEIKHVQIKINDDENWEPDEDFHVQLYDPETRKPLEGQDTKTTVTIIDDDKPGQICFEEQGNIKALATTGVALINIIRKNGCDGDVHVDYETVQLGASEHTASPNVDF
mmetsp:Transcript_13616/g.23178  ORF Transcript_13616/g.23178 Transcript_13616/m.23178 type:complete len:475 (-) Transcript_13616:216-1640(-)